MVISAAIFLIAFLIWFLVWIHEKQENPAFIQYWRSLTRFDRVFLTTMFVVMTLIGGSKDPAITKLFKLLFWPYGEVSQLVPAWIATTHAENDHIVITNLLTTMESNINTNTINISFDWHAPNRLPEHNRQNTLGWTVWVTPITIDGILYEDHYVAFNAQASDAPAVINIEYARTLSDGTIERYTSSVVTNSYPEKVDIHLQSGTYPCYWFRCAVPIPFVNEPRDWNGEALFGSPHGSGGGFDLAGTLVIDDGNNVWVGATTNIILNGVGQSFANGINITEVLP